jgi:hypothetical protein
MNAEHRKRVRGQRRTIATRRRTRDRRMLLVVAHGRHTVTALADLTEAASAGALSIIDLRWDAGADEFDLIMSLSVVGGPVTMARARAALCAVAQRQHIAVKLYPMSYLRGTG